MSLAFAASFLSNYLPDRWVLIALALVGLTSGLLGCFALLRRQSLLGDALAHAALPGVCLAYILSGHQKEPWVLLLGATAAGALGSFVLLSLRGSRIKPDAALGIVLSSFFGLGVMLLAWLQRKPDGRLSGLEDYIFGQAAYLSWEHVRVMLPLAGAVALAVALFYKELKLYSFDPEYASTAGFSRRILDILMALLTVAGVMISLRAIGVVLTTALLIIPAAAARQWTDRLSHMLFFAAAVGILSGLGGAVWSQSKAHTPTGPAVTLVATGFLAASLTLSPRRGVLWQWLRLRAHRRRVRRENLLADFYRLGEPGHDWTSARTVADLAAIRSQSVHRVEKTLRQLQSLGQVEPQADAWRLTPSSLEEAARLVRNHRLWELYLTHRLDLPADHVHRDAEAMEHALSPEVVNELEALLGHPTEDPHGRPLPTTR